MASPFILSVRGVVYKLPNCIIHEWVEQAIQFGARREIGGLQP